MIYEIRGKQVMLDSDLARLYECTNGTKDINKAVKRNIKRFPKEFYFQLTEEEVDNLSLRFQIGTLNSQGNFRGQHLKYLPYVFTEQGVAMLSSVLHTEKAVCTSIRIMNAFVALRHYYIENKDIYKTLNNINDKLIDHDKKFEYIFSKFDKKEFLFLPGEVYDSYSELINILSTASKEVIIIDSYADKSMLDIIRNFSINFILITKNKSKLKEIEIDKFNKQYNNKLKVIRTNKFHDRYIIIDNNYIYHMGTSINYLGEKVFSINKLEDEFVIDNLLDYVNKFLNEKL